MEKTQSSIWWKWTIYCASGELLGIGIAGAIAYGVNSTLGEPQTLPAKLLVLSCMLVAGFIEGFLLGTLQWIALRDKFPEVPRKEWVFYTVLVAVLGWLLGMLPSLFFIAPSTAPVAENPPPDFENPLIFALLSVGSGVVLGAIFGLFQWFSLRKYVKKAYRWIIANALGWGIGLGWIYLFASIPTAQSPLMFNLLMGVVGGFLAGLSVGAITGYFLVKM